MWRPCVRGVDFIYSVMVGLGKICRWELTIFVLLSKAVEEIYFSDANDLKVIVAWGLDEAWPYHATVTLQTLVEIIPSLLVLSEEVIINSAVEQASLWDRTAVTREQYGNLLLYEPCGGMQPIWWHTENSAAATHLLTLRNHRSLVRRHVCSRRKWGHPVALDCNNTVLPEESRCNR